MLQTFPLGSFSLVWYLDMQAFFLFYFSFLGSWLFRLFLLLYYFWTFFLSLLTNWFLLPTHTTLHWDAPNFEVCYYILNKPIVVLLCVATFFLSFSFFPFMLFHIKSSWDPQIDVHFEDATWNVQEECKIQVQYLEHLQRCSVCDPAKILFSFATPPIKLKLGQQILGGLLIANHLDESLWWANEEHSVAVNS